MLIGMTADVPALLHMSACLAIIQAFVLWHSLAVEHPFKAYICHVMFADWEGSQNKRSLAGSGVGCRADEQRGEGCPFWVCNHASHVHEHHHPR